jgi:hypothetical protein
MKAIVRTSIIALMVFAGYATLASPVTPATTSTAGPMSPYCHGCQVPTSKPNLK